MRTATIEMTAKEASEALADYAVSKTEEDKMILKAYRAIKNGKRIIDLNLTMKLAGVDEKGLPKLAIARADARGCWLAYSTGWEQVHFRSRQSTWGSSGIRKQVSIPIEFLPGIADVTGTKHAVAPIIPPKYRPSNQKNYWLLWEAVWKKSPPIDPILLRHFKGSLYMVIAAWNLTPVERAVLRGRIE